MTPAAPPPATPGHVVRPRVEGDREDEILEAAVELLVDLGYDRLTMDAVAREAHASKATLYRRWESKASLVIDALLRAKGMPDPHAADTGTLRGDLLATFCGHDGMANPRTSSVMGAMITAISTDEEFAEKFRERFIAPKTRITEEIYQRAIARGEVAADLDVEVIGPALAGVVLHRMYVMGAPPDDDVVRRIVDNLILPAVLTTSHQTSTTDNKPGTTSKTRKTQ